MATTTEAPPTSPTGSQTREPPKGPQESPCLATGHAPPADANTEAPGEVGYVLHPHAEAATNDYHQHTGCDDHPNQPTVVKPAVAEVARGPEPQPCRAAEFHHKTRQGEPHPLAPTAENPPEATVAPCKGTAEDKARGDAVAMYAVATPNPKPANGGSYPRTFHRTQIPSDLQHPAAYQ